VVEGAEGAEGAEMLRYQGAGCQYLPP